MLKKDLLAHWVRERENIRKKKEAGETRPWTSDPILQNFKFTNVHREDDRVSQWVARYMRRPNKDDRHLWFLMTVAILINKPETLQQLMPHLVKDGEVTWRPEVFIDLLQHMMAAGEKVYSGAYIVSTNGRKMDKSEYIANHVLTPLWNAREEITPKWKGTLGEFHERLVAFDGMGSFLAAQVVAATKYYGHLHDARDWETWAASGPGSRRGMNRLYGHFLHHTWKEKDWLWLLQNEVKPFIGNVMGYDVHAQDCQNCLCEFDKYVRTMTGEGKPRSRYPGA